MRLFQASCLCLLIVATSVCANPSAPDRPVSTTGGDASSQQAREGVAGQITTEQGAAVEGATVTARALDSSGPAVPELAIVSDARGRYLWPLRAGRYEITVMLDGYQSASKSVTVRAGELATLDFVLSRERAAG